MSDVNALWNVMYSIIDDGANLLCWFKKIRLRNNTPACFTKELLEMMNRKQELMRQILRINREEDHQLLHKQKGLVRNALKLASQETITTTLEENRTNPKRFWRCLNRNFALGKKSINKTCVRVKENDGNIIEGEELVFSR